MNSTILSYLVLGCLFSIIVLLCVLIKSRVDKKEKYDEFEDKVNYEEIIIEQDVTPEVMEIVAKRLRKKVMKTFL